MKHYGDITKLNGHDLPLVDIITGGSPCQDLSVAGKREGLAGERSGLFMEQIRIVKEMRDESIKRLRSRGTTFNISDIQPRYMVWENVPGAFSSNKGEDFRCVLEETAKIADKGAVIPKPFGGKWTPAGCVMGTGWSIAWRVHDAQFWGVPQRRKRIALVADFGGQSAPEILFERKSVSRDIEESREEGEEITGVIGDNATETISFQERAGCAGGVKESSSNTTEQELCQPSTINPSCSSDGDIAGTLDASYYKGCGERQGKERTVVYGVCSYDSNAMKSSNPHSGIYEADTTRTLDNNGGNPACNQGGMIVLEGNGSRPSHKGDGYKESDVSYTLNSTEQHAVCVGNGQLAQARISDKVGALNCMHDQQAIITYGLDRASFNQGKNAQYDFSVEEDLAQTIVAKGPGGGHDTIGALCARDYKGVGNQYVNEGKVIVQQKSDSL